MALKHWSWHRVVHILSRLRNGLPRNRGSIPSTDKKSFLFQSVQNVSGGQPSSYSLGTGVLICRLKQQVLETDHILHLALSLRMNAPISSTSHMPSWREYGQICLCWNIVWPLITWVISFLLSQTLASFLSKISPFITVTWCNFSPRKRMSVANTLTNSRTAEMDWHPNLGLGRTDNSAPQILSWNEILQIIWLGMGLFGWY